MLETIALVQSDGTGFPFRLITNGLCSNPINMAQQLRAVGLKRASVALMTANPKQYDEIMQPTCEDGPVLSHSDVVATILALSEAGIETEVTAVSSPGVNVADIKQLQRRSWCGLSRKNIPHMSCRFALGLQFFLLIYSTKTDISWGHVFYSAL